MLWFILVIILISVIFYKLNEYYCVLALFKRVRKEDGSKLDIVAVPGVLPHFGNTFDLLNWHWTEKHRILVKLFNYARINHLFAKGKSYLLYFAGFPVYNIANAEDSAELFQSSQILAKGIFYEFLKLFLGDGLVISTDKKWHSRRKMLTPAFHFNVLQSFSDIFKEESLKIVNKLQHLENDEVNVNELSSEFTLNSIIETALGVKLDTIEGSAQYRKKIRDIELVMVERVCNPLMYYPIMFRLFFPQYKRHMKDIKSAHDFSSKIIDRKREEYNNNRQQQKAEENDRDDYGKKKRYAMLNTLLEEESNGNIDHAGICDEVNTFMFEGYDTTSTCLIFTLLNLALHPDVQDKCRQELDTFGDFSSLTVFDFNKMQYLECVLKESLRMYPPVPFISRVCVEETHINGLVLPKGTEVHIHVYDIMRDPKHFSDPNSFRPERFLPENTINRHPYAFIPFSAGSRNCIGQKFALLEMKALMVAIMKNFQILPVSKLENLTFHGGMTLKTQEEIYVKLKKIII